MDILKCGGGCEYVKNMSIYFPLPLLSALLLISLCLSKAPITLYAIRYDVIRYDTIKMSLTLFTLQTTEMLNLSAIVQQ